jgi:hypothetical protein
MNLTPEQKARLDIDAALVAAGWVLQNREACSLAAGAVATANTTPLFTRR